MANFPLFPDTSSRDVYSMGLTDPKIDGMFIAVVLSINAETGRASLQLLNYALGLVDDVQILMPAVGADWGIAALPDVGDLVEVDWTPDGTPYARPTVAFRYWDWIAQSGIKAVRPGELFFKSTGGGKGLLSELGSVWWKDSVGSQMLLDPVFDLAVLSGKGTGSVSGGPSFATVGGVLRRVLTASGFATEATDLPILPGLLPPNEYHLQVVPAQPSTFVGIPLSLVDLRRGDVYDDFGFRVASPVNPLLNAMEQRKDTTLGFTNRLEQYFVDGSYIKEFGTVTPMVFGQKWDALSSNTWYVKPAGLVELDVLKIDANIINPLVLAALTTGSVRKLVDERILAVINDLCLAMATHTHVVSGTAAAPPVGLSIGGAVSPLPANVVTGDLPAIPLGLAIPVTTVATQAQ